MKVIILCAGQGSRLLPLTENTPKCLLPLHGYTNAITWQLSQLESIGITDVTVVTGFHAEKVEKELALQGSNARTIFNPFYKVADNLGSVWLARHEMTEDFLLINGDTLFKASVVEQVLRDAKQEINVTITRKSAYDDDDMKVVESEDRLLEIGKKLMRDAVNAESIGMILFRGAGVTQFRNAVQDAMQSPEGLSNYYLSVIGALAAHAPVGIVEVPCDSWCETDFPVDLDRAREAIERWSTTATSEQEAA